jgi:glucose-1-phosphate thymidylyltransferase
VGGYGMKGLILAGGLGTRLRPLSHTGPKQLIPVANKPVLHYIIEDLKNSGVTDIGIIVGYTPERIKYIVDSCGDGSKFGVKLTYIEQDAPKGLAHAVYTAKKFLGKDNFVVYLGDNMLSNGIKDYSEKFRNSNYQAEILLSSVDDPRKYGVAILNEEGEVIEVEEKPQKPKSKLAIVGVYFFRSTIFEIIEKINPGKGGELQLTDAIKLMMNSDGKIKAHIVKGWWDDTGTTGAVLRANHLTLMHLKHDIKGTVESTASITGTVSVGKGTIVKDGTIIKGPVIIGENCSIGPNSYIGPFTSIGDNSKITNGEIESSIVLGNCEINFNEKIVDSLIGKNVKILSENKLPKGHKLVLGEHSEITL